MPDEPRISVIVPIYNVEKFLDQCLKSIQAQSFEDFEAICLNDGSTDASLSIIESFTNADNRFLLIDKENEGYGASCNRGIDAARGEYISIIEPDDYIEPTMFGEMLAFGDSFSEPVDIIKALWFDVVNWDSAETLHNKPSYLYKRLKTSSAPFTIEQAPLLLESHPAIWSALYRKDFLNQQGIRFRPYPGAGWADNPFLIETMVKASSIVFLDKMFYHYRNDLPKTKKDSTTTPNMLPIERWLEMSQLLESLQVQDGGIWQAHYVRGFNYLDVLAEEYDVSILKEDELVRQMFSIMDEKLVLAIEKLSPEKKRFFLEMRGKDSSQVHASAYNSYLAKELLHRIRAYGMSETIKGIKNRSDGFV